MALKKLAPVHPGEILDEQFLKPLGLTQFRLAKGLGVSGRRINEIVHGKRSISADTGLRQGRFFRNSLRFWLNLQSSNDLEVEADRLGPTLARDVEVLRRTGRSGTNVRSEHEATAGRAHAWASSTGDGSIASQRLEALQSCSVNRAQARSKCCMLRGRHQATSAGRAATHSIGCQ